MNNHELEVGSLGVVWVTKSQGTWLSRLNLVCERLPFYGSGRVSERGQARPLLDTGSGRGAPFQGPAPEI